MANKNIGYQKTFLGKSLPFPTIDKTILAPLKKGTSGEIVYTHYSTFLHAKRKLPYLCAVNIKGEAYLAPIRAGNEPWDFSDQVDVQYQIDNGFYGKDLNTFDRGHIVRRVDPCWGTQPIANQAEAETFTWTNCTPQHKKLNQTGGIWYQLEQHVMEHGVKNKIADVSVFAGPVLAKDDPAFIVQYNGADVPIPVVYWKVIAWKKTTGELNAVGFMMSQWEWIKDKVKKPPAAPKRGIRVAKPKLEDTYFENLKFKDHKTYQVPIAAIEKATGIKFSWPGVKFPYKKKEFAAVSGKKLTEVRPMQLPAKRKGLGGATSKPKAFTKAEVNKAIEGKFTGALKQYEIKGVTL